MNTGIKVFAPASVSNLACGFELLGLALEHLGDEIVLKKRDKKGLVISAIKGINHSLPLDIMSNTAGYAGKKLLEFLKMEDAGIEMVIHKNMPSGTGLGSSAASAAAAVWGINALLKTGLSKQELLPFAVAAEQMADGSFHAENVAPALMGGILFIRDNTTLDVHRLPCPPGLNVTVVLPEITVYTKDARAIVSKELHLGDHITQSGNLGGLIIGLYQSDFELIGRSLNDVVIEPQRAHLIPHFYEVKEAALRSGVLGCSISGAGPAIFAISDNSLTAENAGNAMQSVFLKAKIKAEVIISTINKNGAVIV